MVYGGLVPDDHVQAFAGNQGGNFGQGGISVLGGGFLIKIHHQSLVYFNQVLFAASQVFPQIGFQQGAGGGACGAVVDNRHGQAGGKGLAVYHGAYGAQDADDKNHSQEVEFIILPHIPGPVFPGHVFQFLPFVFCFFSDGHSLCIPSVSLCCICTDRPFHVSIPHPALSY